MLCLASQFQCELAHSLLMGMGSDSCPTSCYIAANCNQKVSSAGNIITPIESSTGREARQSHKMKVQMLSLFAIVVLSFTAEKCRQLVGEESSSKAGKERFTFLNCFDLSYGTVACILKEIVKLYLYYVRAIHVHKVRIEATQRALGENLSQGQSFCEAMKLAREVGDATARQASLQVKHIMGPIISSGWDFFETLYVGGTLAEGMVRSSGTFIGAYAGGIIGEGNLRWFGFLVGSQLGSWVGGRIGLMLYDVGIGVQYLLQLITQGSSSYPIVKSINYTEQE